MAPSDAVQLSRREVDTESRGPCGTILQRTGIMAKRDRDGSTRTGPRIVTARMAGKARLDDKMGAPVVSGVRSPHTQDTMQSRQCQVAVSGTTSSSSTRTPRSTTTTTTPAATKPNEAPVVAFTALQQVGFATMRRNMKKRKRV